MFSPPDLSHCAATVRRLDRDRFLTALFAPSAVREDVLALYAFNCEISRIGGQVSEPMLGLIRLQWWQDLVAAACEGGAVAASGHPVAGALVAAIQRHQLPFDLFEDLMLARRLDMEPQPIADSETLAEYVRCTGGNLNRLVLRVVSGGNLDADSPADVAAGKVGAAYAVCGLLRALPFFLQEGRLFLPADALQEAGESAVSALWQGRVEAPVRQIVQELAEAAADALDEARRLHPRHGRLAAAAFLPARVAKAGLKAVHRAGYDPLSPSTQRYKASIINIIYGYVKA